VGVIAGNLRATATLVGLSLAVVFLVLLTIVVPLLLRGRSHGLRPARFVAATSYFSLIGLGFMVVEIGLMQRFSILLGHPMYSLAITLMSMILASGLGSLCSDRLDLDLRGPLRAIPVVTAAVIAVGAMAGEATIELTMALPLVARAGAVMAFTFPIGFLMGFFFPLGMRLLRERSAVVQSWMWGLNGALGVLGTLVSVLIAMAFGIRASLLAGAACYLLLTAPFYALLPDRKAAVETSAALASRQAS
jgi:hypothetical protein